MTPQNDLAANALGFGDPTQRTQQRCLHCDYQSRKREVPEETHPCIGDLSYLEVSIGGERHAQRENEDLGGVACHPSSSYVVYENSMQSMAMTAHC